MSWALSWTSQAGAFEHAHAVSTGYQYAHVRANSGKTFHNHVVPLGYLGRYGESWAGIVRASVLLPVLAHQGDGGFFPGSIYDSTVGFDGLIGLGHRFRAPFELQADLSVGPHVHWLEYSSNQFVEWSTVSAGVGSQLGLTRTLPRSWLGARTQLGVHWALQFDLADFSRPDDFSWGWGTQLALSFGLAWGRK